MSLQVPASMAQAPVNLTMLKALRFPFSKGLQNKFIQINVLTPNQKIPDKVQVTPTIFTVPDYNMYSADDAFKWLQQEIIKEQRNQNNQFTRTTSLPTPHQKHVRTACENRPSSGNTWPSAGSAVPLIRLSTSVEFGCRTTTSMLRSPKQQ